MPDELIQYIYLGDKLTDPRYKNQKCSAIRRTNGKCTRGRNGNFLVSFKSGEKVVVLGRLLRKLKEENSLINYSPHHSPEIFLRTGKDDQNL